MHTRPACLGITLILLLSFGFNVLAGGVDEPAIREYDVLRSFPAGRLAALSSGDKPDAQGLTGGNRARGSWLEAGGQRGSCRGVIAAVVAGDLAAADDAWRGIEVAFAHQRADGGFEAEIRPNGASARSHGAAVETAFFFCRSWAGRSWSSASRLMRRISRRVLRRSSRNSAAPVISSPPGTAASSPTAATP